MAITLQEYLKSNDEVQAARKKAQAAKAELDSARTAMAGTTRPGVPASVTGQTSSRQEAALAAYAAAQRQLEQAESKATNFFNSNVEKISKKYDEKKISQAKQRLEEALAQRERLVGTVNPQQLTALDNKIADLNDQINLTGKYAPKTEVQTTPGDTGATGTRDIANEIATAAKYLYTLEEPARLQWAKDLKASGYNVPITGVFNNALVDAYTIALTENQQRNTYAPEPLSFAQFLVEKERETKGLEAAGKGKGGKLAPGTVSISTDSEAAAIVNRIFQADFGRAPTPSELDREKKALIAEEKKFSSVTRPVKRVGPGGVEYVEYVGGIDREQFLTDRLRKTDEYKDRRTAERRLTKDELAKTARANGLDIEKDFGDVVNTWTQRVQNGEDIDIFRTLIRGTAKLGMPQNVQGLMDNGLDLESIYAPYKRVMASNLELTPDSINLNDPLLRTAIGPDKEMSIYDFEKSIRRDNRWQYTNKAREEVADATLRVLRDFGLMG